MKKLLVLIIILIMVSAGTFFYIKKDTINDTGNDVMNINEKNSQISKADTSNWNTYKDEKYNFEIKFNPEWKIESQQQRGARGEILWVIPDETRNDIGMDIVRVKSRKTPKDWLLYPELGGTTGGITFDKEYYINDYPVYYAEFDNPLVYLTHDYIFSDGENIVKFSFTEKNRNVNQKTGEIEETSFSEYLPDFENMVNSIEFTQ